MGKVNTLWEMGTTIKYQIIRMFGVNMFPDIYYWALCVGYPFPPTKIHSLEYVMTVDDPMQTLLIMLFQLQ